MSNAEISIFVKMTRDGYTHGKSHYIAYLVSNELGENLGSHTGKSLAAVINNAALAGQSIAGPETVGVSLKIEEMHDDPAPTKRAFCDTTLDEWDYARAERVATHLLGAAK